MTELPPIKGGGEPWVWPDGTPVRVDRSGDFADELEPPRFDAPPGPWAGARVFWRWVAERLFAS